MLSSTIQEYLEGRQLEEEASSRHLSIGSTKCPKPLHDAMKM